MCAHRRFVPVTHAQAMTRVTDRLALCKRSQDAGKPGQLVIIHGQARIGLAWAVPFP